MEKFKRFIDILVDKSSNEHLELLDFICRLSESELNDWSIVKISKTVVKIQHSLEPDVYDVYYIAFNEEVSPESFSCIYQYPELDEYLQLTGSIVEKRKDVSIKQLTVKNIIKTFDKLWNESVEKL